MVPLVVILLVLAAAARPVPARQTPGERAVLRLASDIHAAELRRDATILDRAWAPDYVETNQFGVVHSKAERLAEVRSGANVFETIRQREVRVRVYGETAVVTERLDVRGKVAGRSVADVVRVLTVFVERDGRWQAVAAQYTRVVGE
jgi:hypothetical protein